MRPSLKFANQMLLVGIAGVGIACATAAPEQKPVAQMTAPAAPPREASAEDLHRDAQQRLAARDFAGAQAGLDRTLAKDPANAEALFESGWIAEQQGKAPQAMANYKKALAAEPEHLGAALNLARLYRFLDDYADGEQVIRVSLQKHEADPRLLNALSGLLRLDKKLDEAEAMVHRVLMRHPNDADAYKNLALIEVDRGKPRLAEVSLNNARKLDPKDPGISNNLGLLAWNKGELLSAREKFNDALKLDQTFAPAWANLGALALSYRDYPVAADSYSKATALDPARWDLELAYAWSLEGLKKPGEAQVAYEKVLSLRPGQDDALYGKATALKAQNKLPEAMEAFKSYSQLPQAAKSKDAQAQIAQIDMRLKNPPLKAPPLEKHEANPQAGADISQLALPGGAAAPADAASAAALPSALPADDATAVPPAAATPNSPAPASPPASGDAPAASAPATPPAGLPAIPAPAPSSGGDKPPSNDTRSGAPTAAAASK